MSSAIRKDDIVAVFEGWIAERRAAGDWADYVRRGCLNRTVIAAELGFARSVWGSNPMLRALLLQIENELRTNGTLPAETPKLSDAVDVPSAASLSAGRRNPSDAQQMKRLQSENAAMKAELEEMRTRLERYKLMDEILGETGRLPRP